MIDANAAFVFVEQRAIHSHADEITWMARQKINMILRVQLVDDEVESAMQSIVEILSTDWKAELRT